MMLKISDLRPGDKVNMTCEIVDEDGALALWTPDERLCMLGEFALSGGTLPGFSIVSEPTEDATAKYCPKCEKSIVHQWNQGGEHLCPSCMSPLQSDEADGAAYAALARIRQIVEEWRADLSLATGPQISAIYALACGKPEDWRPE